MIRIDSPTITNPNIGTVVGSGVNTQIAYFSASTTLSGSNGLVWTGSALRVGTILAGSADSGILTLGGTGGANNNNLLWDYETVANAVGLSSVTGVLRINSDIRYKHNDDVFAEFGARSTISADVFLGWVTIGNHNLQLAIPVGSSAGSGYYSLMERANISTANRSPLATSADPVLRIYSSDATVAGDYGEFYHDQTDFYVVSGGGSIILDSMDRIFLDSAGDKVVFMSSGTELLAIRNNAAEAQTTFGLYDAAGNQLIITNINNSYFYE